MSYLNELAISVISESFNAISRLEDENVKLRRDIRDHEAAMVEHIGVISRQKEKIDKLEKNIELNKNSGG